jgi:hypothetical protein
MINIKEVIMCFIAVLLCTSWIGAQSKRENVTGRSIKSPVISQSSNRTQLLEKAKSDWTDFLAAFRTALIKRDRRALYSMTAKNFHGNCAMPRRNFFATNERIEHYLDILTPGRSKYHNDYEVGPAEYNEDSNVIQSWMKMACWSLHFEYRKETGWLLTYYGQPCDGC